MVSILSSVVQSAISRTLGSEIINSTSSRGGMGTTRFLKDSYTSESLRVTVRNLRNSSLSPVLD